MKPYFENMPGFGRPLSERQIADAADNIEQIETAEKALDQAVAAVQEAGLPEEKINSRGQLTVWQRLEYMVDPGTWCPLHSLFNPFDNAERPLSTCRGMITS